MFVSCNTNDEGNGSDKNDFGDTWSYVFRSWICQNMCTSSEIISSISSWLEMLLIRATKQHRSKFKNTSIFAELIESDNFTFTLKQHNHINNNLSRLREINFYIMQWHEKSSETTGNEMEQVTQFRYIIRR